jgi:hypothetical protein
VVSPLSQFSLRQDDGQQMKIKINFDLIPRFNQPHRFRGYMTSGIADIDR